MSIDVDKIKDNIISGTRSNKKIKKRRTFKTVQKKREIITNIIVGIVVIFFIATGILFAFSIFISKVEIKDGTISYVHGYSAATVISGSMEPTIHVGDIVIIQKCDDYNNGDVITFLAEDGEVYTHRIVSVGYDQFKTKGDANNTVDEFLAYKENIAGKVEYKIPYLGKYLILISQKLSKYYLGILITIILFLVITVIYDMIKIIKTDFTKEELKTLETQEFNKRKRKMLSLIYYYKVKKRLYNSKVK